MTAAGVHIERVVTSGVFTLDGGTWDVDNNVWIVGDDQEVVVIDAAHDADAIAEAVGDRRLTAIVSTHAHNDHVNAAPALAAATGAPILLHLDDRLLCTHPDRAPDGYLSDNQRIEGGETQLQVLDTPGHTPGAVCLHLPELGTVFTGDTLFAGGPGATGRSYSHFPTIIRSIRDRLLVLPPTTTVRTGHGADTIIGDEAPHLAKHGSREATDAGSGRPVLPVGARPAGRVFRCDAPRLPWWTGALPAPGGERRARARARTGPGPR